MTIEPWQQRVLDHLRAEKQRQEEQLGVLCDETVKVLSFEGGSQKDVTAAHIELTEEAIRRLDDAISLAESELGLR